MPNQPLKSPLPKNIVPAILAYSKHEFLQKLQKARDLKAKMVQIDVLDNTHIKNKSYSAPDKLAKLNIDIPFEVHLMTSKPEKNIEKWAKLGAKRIIFHIEATADPLKVIKEIKGYKIKAVIAINPDTPIQALDLIFKEISGIVMLGVQPGFGGQNFQPSILKKLKLIKQKFPKLPIEVDGGVRATNAQKILDAGADSLAVGSALDQIVV